MTGFFEVQGVFTLCLAQVVSFFTIGLCFYDQNQNQKEGQCGLNEAHNHPRSFRR